MKKSLFQFITIIPLALLLCLSFSCQKQGEKAETEVGALSDEDVAAIKTVYDDYEQALLAGGTEATLEFYTEDITVIMEKGVRFKGQGALKEALKAYGEVFPTVTAFNQTLEEIDGQGNLAFAWGTRSMTIAVEGAPEPTQWTGKFLEILREQEDGSWLIARAIGVSD